ncbi:MAG: hypothetical protein WCJ30_11970, partial [Deltaproteobacteria bacterium]
MLRSPPRLAHSLAAICLSACGARSELSVPGPSIDAATDARIADTRAPDAVETAVPCPSFYVAVPPLRVFGGAPHSYVTPFALGRAGGYDVAAFHNDAFTSADPPSGIVRRVVPAVSPAGLDLGTPLAVAPRAGTAPRFGVAGDTLAACYGSQETRRVTIATFDAAYATTSLGTVTVGTGLTCLGFTASNERFMAFWHALYSMASADVESGEWSTSGAEVRAPRVEQVGDWGAFDTA